jgi:hypothetical protein
MARRRGWGIPLGIVLGAAIALPIFFAWVGFFAPQGPLLSEADALRIGSSTDLMAKATSSMNCNVHRTHWDQEAFASEALNPDSPYAGVMADHGVWTLSWSCLPKNAYGGGLQVHQVIDDTTGELLLETSRFLA